MKCECLVYADPSGTPYTTPKVCGNPTGKPITAEKNIGSAIRVVACNSHRRRLRLKGYVLRFTTL